MAFRSVRPRTLVLNSLTKTIQRSKSTAVAADLLDHGDISRKEWLNAKPFETIPGRRSLPFIKTSWEVFTKDFMRDRMHWMNRKYSEKYGPIFKSEIIGVDPMVTICDPEEIEKVFRADGKFPERPAVETLKAYRQSKVETFEHLGLLITQGTEWWNLRSKVQQPLMKPLNMMKYLPIMEGVSLEMVERIRSIRDEKLETPDDFLNEMFKWALESVALVVLDARFGSLKGNLPASSEPQKMIDATITTFQCLQDLEFGGPPLWKIFNTPGLKKLHAAQDTFVDVTMKYINQALARVAEKTNDSDQTILEEILSRGSSTKDAVVMVMDMLMAGIDTTSSAQSYVFYQLGRNPDKQEKLREEINRFFPTTDTPVTAEKLNEMKYLKACMKETMRLTPVVVGNFRTNTVDLVLAGYQVPKGCMIIMPHQYISKLEKHFKDADKFIPERWIKGHPLAAKPHPYTMLPFGFGPRMCIGRRIAEQEMWLLTIKVLQQMKIEWHYGELDCITRSVNTPDKPMKLKFIDL